MARLCQPASWLSMHPASFRLARGNAGSRIHIATVSILYTFQYFALAQQKLPDMSNPYNAKAPSARYPPPATRRAHARFCAEFLTYRAAIGLRLRIAAPFFWAIVYLANMRCMSVIGMLILFQHPFGRCAPRPLADPTAAIAGPMARDNAQGELDAETSSA